ncbi:hypothetical protein F4679DRAFT_537558, partial [Xylaria curta]
MPSVQDIPPSDLLDPNSLGLDIRSIIIHSMSWLTGLATVAVILRFWSRGIARQKLAIDDWLVLGALGLEYSVFTVQMIMTLNGIGRSTLAVLTMPDALNHLNNIVKCAYTLIPLISTTLACMKLSVLALYRRIFPTRIIRLGVHCIGTIVIMWWIATVAVGLFGCSPISKGWSFDRSTCIQQLPPFNTGNTVTAFVIDIAILVLPVHDILKLHMGLWQKLAVAGLFSLGSVSAVAGWIRWGILTSYYNDSTTDSLSAYGIPSIIIILEICVGIIGVSLTTIRPLIKTLLRRFRHSDTSKTKGDQQHDHPEIITIGGSGQPSVLHQGSYQKEHTFSSEYSLPQYSASASPGRV